MFLIVPISCLIIGVGVALPIYLTQNSSDNIDPNSAILVSTKSISDKYLTTPSKTKIDVGSDDAIITIGNPLLKLKQLSLDHNGITNFVIKGSVDFGFLLDPNMDCHISGINNATVRCDAYSHDGVTVGKEITIKINGVFNG
ncbi:hypothetical protein FACS189459_7270 [Bacilli bacterium]|nr:hypothetical protein FACS189459_7270 [Bacilli bacterium]